MRLELWEKPNQRIMLCVLMFNIFANSTENEEYKQNSVGVLNRDSSSTEENS